MDLFLMFLLFAGFPVLILLLQKPLRAYRNWGYERYFDANVTYYYGQYDKILTDFSPYYRSLPLPQRRRYVIRVGSFIKAKEFHYHGLEPEPHMPVMIAAAAVQITFGLKRYFLTFFEKIHVMHADYHYGIHEVPFQGHVNSTGIHISWNNFISGYENYQDAHNVGIHEMAHALAYVNFISSDLWSRERKFIRRWSEFTSVARPIFHAMQKGEVTILNRYAATNYHEFWAVSLEHFFEQPQMMKAAMPELYGSICRLLNQDPLTPEKILA